MNATGDRWRLVVLLSATTTAGYMCRVNISTAGALIMPEFGLSQVAMGRVFSAFLLGYALFQIPAGMLSDHLGPKRTLAMATGAWVLLTVAPVLLSLNLIESIPFSFGSFTAFRFLLGIAASPSYPASARGVSAWISLPFQGRASSLVLVSVGLGSALAPPLVSWAMIEWGWRAAMVLSVIPAFVVCMIWQKVPHQVGLARKEETNAAAAGTSSLKSGKFILLTISYTLQGYVGYIFINWFYLYLVQERHFGLVAGAWATSLGWVLTVVSIPLGGIIFDKLMRTGVRAHYFPLAAMSVAGILISIGARTENGVLAAGILALATALMLCVEGPFWSTMIRVAPGRSGLAGGIMNGGCNAGGLVSPIVTPLVASYVGWENALHIAAALAVVGGMLWLGIRDGSRPAPT